MGRSAEEIKKDIESGNTALGIEFGSTRIKAVLTDGTTAPIAQGSYEWENRLENGIWTYSLEDIWKGLKDCYADLAADVKKQYGLTLKKVGAMGVSAMMHGYMAFDADGKLLVPFRTWRNTMTAEAARRLTDLFNYNIPQRWSIAHLYQAVINGEEHVSRVHFLTTLAGYVHWKLTGKQVLGVGDASGMFPIDPATGQYDAEMLDKFEEMMVPKGYPWKLRDLLPEVLSAGDEAGTLTEEGAKLLDESGNLEAGIPLCPPEGDAGTGMTATNSVAVRTGNVSAGTSVFAMVVLESFSTQVTSYSLTNVRSAAIRSFFTSAIFKPLIRSNSFMFLSYFRAALRLFPGCCFDYIMIFAKRKECFFVILHLCTISTKQCWFIRVFIAQKRHLYSKTQQKSRVNRSPFRVDSSCLLMLFSADLCQVFLIITNVT